MSSARNGSRARWQGVSVCALQLSETPASQESHELVAMLHGVFTGGVRYDRKHPGRPSNLQTKSIERYQHRSIIHSVFSIAYTFSVSLGRVLRSFMISLSLSPTTAIICQPIAILSLGRFEVKMIRTSPGVHPVDCHWRFEGALVGLELLQGVSSAGSIGDDTSSLSRSEVFKNAGQLLGSRSGLLYVFMWHRNVSQCPNCKLPSICMPAL